MPIDKKANTQWAKSAISYKNYQDFIGKKRDRFKLTIVDLFYISNFKGGNATINEPEDIIEEKLEAYSTILRTISKKYEGKALQDLDKEEADDLIETILLICYLTNKGTETKIDVFSVSYLSALLSAYFPDLIPILDRRVLINLGLVKSENIDPYGQIKNIVLFYEPLIRRVAKECKQKGISVRELDRSLFITKLREL